MRFTLAALASLATLLAPTHAQQPVGSILAYANGWTEGDYICDGDLVTSFNVPNVADQTCTAAPGVDCITGVSFADAYDCRVHVYSDSGCTQSIADEYMYFNGLDYYHVPGTQSFRVVCSE